MNAHDHNHLNPDALRDATLEIYSLYWLVSIANLYGTFEDPAFVEYTHTRQNCGLINMKLLV